MPDWPITAYLFQRQETDLFAVSLDKSAAALPPLGNDQRWLLREEFRLGLLYPMPVPMEPDKVLRGIEANGYFLFDLWQR